MAQPDLRIDGKVVIRSERDGNPEIYIMDFDGSNQTRLTNNAVEDGEPMISPDGTKIAFISRRDGNREIYVMDIDGNNPLRLTNEPAEDVGPSWSPDGTKIAFYTIRDGNYEIYVMDADGGNPTNITNHLASDDGRPTWSPDGSKLAFRTGRDGNREIYTANIDGSNPVRLTNNGLNDSGPMWSPDGTRIAFHRSSGSNSVYVMNANGSGQTFLSSVTPFGDAFPVWSPDGTELYFNAERDGNGEIYRMNIDASDQTRLTFDPASDSGSAAALPLRIGAAVLGNSALRTMKVLNTGSSNLTVSNITSSDGQFTITPTSFTVTPGGNQDITVTFAPTSTGIAYTTLTIASNDADSPSTQLIVNGTGQVPDLQIDGQIVFYAVPSGESDGEIYKVNADGSNLVRLTNNAIYDLEVSFSPDGSKILFAANPIGDPNREIYVMDADGSNLVQLTNNLAEDAGPAFSPDGSKIAFYSKRDGNYEIYVMDANGSNQVNLTNSPVDENGRPNWKPDGTKLAYRKNVGGNLSIYTIEPDGSNETLLINYGQSDHSLIWSADMTKVAFVSNGDVSSHEIYVANDDGTGIVRMTNNSFSDGAPSWSPDGSTIFFQSERTVPNQLEIFQIDADGSNETLLLNVGLGGAGTTHSTFYQIGTSAVGSPVGRIMTIRNTGSGNLTVSDITTSDSQFTIVPTNFAVPSGGNQDVTVTFTPTVAATTYSTLTISSDDPDSPSTQLIINGTGETAIVAVSVPDVTSLYEQTISIPVQVGDTSNLGIVAAEVFICYDGDLITPFSAGLTSTLAASGWSIETNIEEGGQIDTYKIAMATDDDVLVGAGTLVNIEFQVADVRVPSSSVLQLKHVLFNDGNPLNTTTDGSVTLVGTDGTISCAVSGGSTAGVIPGQTVDITVTDADENRNAGSADSFIVRATNGNQTETVTVTETGNSTGIFTGSIGTTFSLASTTASSSSNGTIEVEAGDLLAFCFDDSLDAAGNTVERCDQKNALGGIDGYVQSTIVVQPGDTARVKLIDADLTADSQSVLVENLRSGELESLVLHVFSPGSSVYYGRLFTSLAPSPGLDSTLSILDCDTLRVTYFDQLTALGSQASIGDSTFGVDLFGDANDNGASNAFDAALTLLHVLNPSLVLWDSLSVNVDDQAPIGDITPYDASLILQKRVGLIDRFPIQEPTSANHPQPETSLQPGPKPAPDERLISLRAGEGYLSVWADERDGIVSGEVLIEGIDGEVKMGEELGTFLSASRAQAEGLRIVFAGAEAVRGSGELLRVYGAGSAEARLIGAEFNDGWMIARLELAPLGSVPTVFALHANAPNPFNPETHIRFDLPRETAVQLHVFDVLGQRVRTLVAESMPAGAHQVLWNGRDNRGVQVSSGVYFYRLQAGDFLQSRRMLLLK